MVVRTVKSHGRALEGGILAPLIVVGRTVTTRVRLFLQAPPTCMGAGSEQLQVNRLIGVINRLQRAETRTKGAQAQMTLSQRAEVHHLFPIEIMRVQHRFRAPHLPAVGTFPHVFPAPPG